MPETPELPACAAIQMPDGVIFAGHRHHDCLSMINTTFSDRLAHVGSVMGFMTNHGRFVDRHEALMMRLKEGLDSASIDGNGYRGNELYSEDLY